jgi:hypothetical protein
MANAIIEYYYIKNNILFATTIMAKKHFPTTDY